MKTRLLLVMLAACGGGGTSTTPGSGGGKDGAPVGEAAKPASGPEELCLAGDCKSGKGVHTRGRGAERAIVDGSFDGGKRTGDAVVYRVAGQTFETLEIDAASGTCTLHHPLFDVVGQMTADPAPQLVDESAAVMLPTGEWFFADWSNKTVSPKDSNLTGARSVPKIPGDYADLFASVAILEEARHAARELELRPPGSDDQPFVKHVAIEPLVAFVPDPKQPVAYIVGVGVVDPDSPAIKAMRAGQTPSGPITILRADGSTSQLEIADGAVKRWPTWTPSDAGWKATVTTKLAEIESARATATAKLRVARQRRDADNIGQTAHALAGALEAADELVAALPGDQADKITSARLLRDQLSLADARAHMATQLIALADMARPEVAAVIDDVLGQIATDFDTRGIAP